MKHRSSTDNANAVFRTRLAGGGMAEYLLIIFLVGFAALGAVRHFGKVARAQTGNMAKELAGEKADLGAGSGTIDPGAPANEGDAGGSGGGGSAGGGSSDPGSGSGGDGGQGTGGTGNGGGDGSPGGGSGNEGPGGGAGCANKSEKEIQEEVMSHLEGNDSEGNYAYVYLDTVNKPTVGAGFLIRSPANAATYPFYKKDGSKASAKEIKDMLSTVESHPQSQKCLAGIYKDCKTAGAYEKYSELRLRQDDIDKIGMEKLGDFESQLKQVYDSYDSYPVNVKMALYDMIYNLGKGGIESTFKKFTAAIRAKDWETAAKESYRSQVSDTRNAYVKNLLLNADSANCEAVALVWESGVHLARIVTKLSGYHRSA